MASRLDRRFVMIQIQRVEMGVHLTVERLKLDLYVQIKAKNVLQFAEMT